MTTNSAFCTFSPFHFRSSGALVTPLSPFLDDQFQATPPLQTTRRRWWSTCCGCSTSRRASSVPSPTALWRRRRRRGPRRLRGPSKRRARHNSRIRIPKHPAVIVGAQKASKSTIPFCASTPDPLEYRVPDHTPPPPRTGPRPRRPPLRRRTPRPSSAWSSAAASPSSRRRACPPFGIDGTKPGDIHPSSRWGRPGLRPPL